MLRLVHRSQEDSHVSDYGLLGRRRGRAAVVIRRSSARSHAESTIRRGGKSAGRPFATTWNRDSSFGSPASGCRPRLRKTDARGQGTLHGPLGLLGDEDLAAVPGRADPRDRVHRKAHVPGVGHGRPTAVDTGSDADVDPVRPRVLARASAGSRAPRRARRTLARRWRSTRRRARRLRDHRRLGRHGAGPCASRSAPTGSDVRAGGGGSVEPSMSVMRNVTMPVGSALRSTGLGARSDRICPVMNPTGTMPYRLAAFRSRLRARSRASSFSNATRSNRARAFRTCGSSLIGSRRRPFASM